MIHIIWINSSKIKRDPQDPHCEQIDGGTKWLEILKDLVVNKRQRKMSNKDSKPEVRKKFFTQYLEKAHYRKTAERYSILDEVYQSNRHTLMWIPCILWLKIKGYQIGRAIYNTVELLYRWWIGHTSSVWKKSVRFEKSCAYKQHGHLICQDCEHVFEFCDPRIQQIKNMMERHSEIWYNHTIRWIFWEMRELEEKRRL